MIAALVADNAGVVLAAVRAANEDFVGLAPEEPWYDEDLDIEGWGMPGRYGAFKGFEVVLDGSALPLNAWQQRPRPDVRARYPDAPEETQASG